MIPALAAIAIFIGWKWWTRKANTSISTTFTASQANPTQFVNLAIPPGNKPLPTVPTILNVPSKQ